MKQVIGILGLLFLLSCVGNTEWNKVEYNSNLSYPFFNEQSWDYPWYIIKNDDGSFSSTFNDAIVESDTVHLYHTAECATNHQGKHEVNYCSAYKKGDTLFLLFPPSLPAYWLNMEVKVIGNKFKAEASGVPFIPIWLEWKTINQQLTLTTDSYTIGDSIKGKCNFEFTEYVIGDTVKNNFYFSGVFKTVIEKFNEDVR